MKYRSSSPEESALPTPPHSPRTLEATQSAVTLLDSLTSFYQQERYWVHHTRAALELALSKGVDAPPSVLSDSTNISQPPSPQSVASPDSVKSERTTPSMDAIRAQATRWMRRKNMNKLKLQGLAPPHRRRPHRAPPSEPAAHLLEMFSELVDARMESCQRISQLVRESNRPEYCIY